MNKDILKHTFKFVTIIVGAGVLNFPKILSDHGWYGIIYFFFFFLLTYYTSILYKEIYIDFNNKKLLKENKQINEEQEEKENTQLLHDIMIKKYNKYGSFICFFSNELLYLSAATVYLVLLGTLTKDIFDVYNINTFPSRWFILIYGVILYLKLLDKFEETKFLDKFGFIGVLSIFVLILSLFADVSNENSTTEDLTFSFGKYILSLSTISWSFTYHPSIQTEIIDILKEENGEKNYDKIAFFSSFIVFICYTIVSIIGYNNYGNDTETPITDNIENKEIKLIVNITLIINLLVSCFLLLKTSLKYFKRKYNKKKYIKSKLIIITIMILISVSFDDYGLILDFFASLMIPTTTFIIPCILHNDISEKNKKIKTIIIIGSILTSVTGIYYSIDCLVEEYK